MGGMYGGQAGGILNPGGVFTPPDTQAPSINATSSQFTKLLNSYLNATPAIYNNEATYSPKFAALNLANKDLAVSNVGAMTPSIMATMRAYNPSATGVLDTLGTQAAEQLKTNGGLDPALQTRLEQNVRGAQAARGLGNGPSDVAQETNYVTQTQEARRMANQQFAGTVAGEEGNYYKDPFSVVAGTGQPGSTPGLVSPQQSDSMLGTVYNANAAANISTANNTAAADSY